METIDTLAALEALYGQPGDASIRKVARRLTPGYRAWIDRSRFCVLATAGPDGTDASPRGDDGPVVTALDDRTLAMPDWRGNNRLDSLRNIVADDRVSLMFMVPGSDMVVRINGTARLTADAALTGRFERKGVLPRTVIVITIGEVYFQCARALKRARLWSAGDETEGLPTAGVLLDEMTSGEIDGAAYDADWPGRAEKTLW